MTNIVIKDRLSEHEAFMLKRCENSINLGLAAFYQIGNALIKIREFQLYRGKYKTFEHYCLKRWGISKPQVYRLINATYVRANLELEYNEFNNISSPFGDKNQLSKPRLKQVGVKDSNSFQLPSRESQVRPLTKLPQNLQLPAWKMALESAGDKGVKAKDVSKAVATITKKEILETNQVINKRSDQDKIVSEKFKGAYLNLMKAIKEARDGGWKDSTKAAVLNHIDLLKNAVKK
jgi:hypothetical protein